MKDNNINNENYDAINCFARINEKMCNALDEKKCKNCPFFKRRKDIKNNPFYGFSYDDPTRHLYDMKRRHINPDDVIYH